MILEIVTPDQKVFQGEVSGVQVPGTKGSFEVLENHAPLVSALGKGRIRINENGKTQFLDIDSGIIEVHSNRVIVLAESVTRA